VWSLFSTNDLCCQKISLLVVATHAWPPRTGYLSSFLSSLFSLHVSRFQTVSPFPPSEQEEESFDMRIVQVKDWKWLILRTTHIYIYIYIYTYIYIYKYVYTYVEPRIKLISASESVEFKSSECGWKLPCCNQHVYLLITCNHSISQDSSFCPSQYSNLSSPQRDSKVGHGLVP